MRSFVPWLAERRPKPRESSWSAHRRRLSQNYVLTASFLAAFMTWSQGAGHTLAEASASVTRIGRPWTPSKPTSPNSARIASPDSVPETSGYGALATLLNEVGHKLKPHVRCVVNPANRGAGIPDGGLFVANQFEKGQTEPLARPAAGARRRRGQGAERRRDDW